MTEQIPKLIDENKTNPAILTNFPYPNFRSWLINMDENKAKLIIQFQNVILRFKKSVQPALIGFILVQSLYSA
jgi:hypothetical protein